MENITELFNDIYLAAKALIIYQSETAREQVYVEAYDMDATGRPVNAHPLSVQETVALAECLNTSAELDNSYLKPSGLLPSNVLYVDPGTRGFSIWHTKPQKVPLLFVELLGIPSGEAEVPALLWKADKSSLYIYALHICKPAIGTQLYTAPFFNIYENGLVCMGTVEVQAETAACLEDFISQWESYFWNSYFSHLMEGHVPINGNIVQLWQKQVNTGCKFPMEVLKKNGKQLKDLL